ncbi:MAG: ABC transporter substrate-binding protein, partial [Proteobacteria bacterium]|nr:ABC transporter substrate-binding protein [Pseudomonadota bacterium]
QVMKTPGFEARVSLLAPVVETDFDLSTIGRIAIGRPWRSLGDAEQQAMTSLLHELVTTTYASRFGDYDGHAFNTLTSSAIAGNREQVKTELVTRSETVALDYMLIATDHGWKIYDVVANGVSDLALKRSNYASLIADGGVERVLEDIREGIARNRQSD